MYAHPLATSLTLLASSATLLACSGDQFSSNEGPRSGNPTGGSAGLGSGGGGGASGGRGGASTGGTAGGSGGVASTGGAGGTSAAGAGGLDQGGAGGQAMGGAGGAAIVTRDCDSLPPGAGAIFHTSLQNGAAVANPALGSAVGFTPGGAPAIVPAPTGNGMQFDVVSEWLSYLQAPGGVVNVDPRQGTIDFCFSPGFEPTVPAGDATDQNHVLFRIETGETFLQVRKASSANGHNLQVTASTSAGLTETSFAPADVQLFRNLWRRMTISWLYDEAEVDERQVRLYVDGEEISPEPGAGTGPFTMPAPQADGRFLIGGDAVLSSATGSFDELVIYSAPITP